MTEESNLVSRTQPSGLLCLWQCFSYGFDHYDNINNHFVCMRLFWHGDNKRTNKQLGGPRASPLLTTEKASLLQLEANLVDHFCSPDFMTPL